MEPRPREGAIMEALILNKQSIREDFSSCETLSSLIQAVEDKLYEKKKVVCKIVVNGLLLNEDDEKRLSDTRLSEVDFVEIEFRDQAQLLEDSCRDLQTWIQEFKADLINKSELIRSQGSLSAFDFGQVVKNLFWLIGALQAIKSYRLDNEAWESVEKQTTSAVKELELSYSSKDFVLLSDVLEYELQTVLDQWRDRLDSIVSSSTK